jgi:hypothetical protein
MKNEKWNSHPVIDIAKSKGGCSIFLLIPDSRRVWGFLFW